MKEQRALRITVFQDGRICIQNNTHCLSCKALLLLLSAFLARPSCAASNSYCLMLHTQTHKHCLFVNAHLHCMNAHGLIAMSSQVQPDETLSHSRIHRATHTVAYSLMTAPFSFLASFSCSFFSLPSCFSLFLLLFLSPLFTPPLSPPYSLSLSPSMHSPVFQPHNLLSSLDTAPGLAVGMQQHSLLLRRK